MTRNVSVALYTIGAVFVVAIIAVNSTPYANWRASKQLQAYQAAVRQEKQALMGSDTIAVKLKLGTPSFRDSIGATVLWFYLRPGTPDWHTIVWFSKEHSKDGAVRAERISQRPGDPAWPPQDNIDTSVDVEEVIRQYNTYYGVPCDTLMSEQSAQYVYQLPDSDEQNISGRQMFGTAALVRFLWIDLANGKTLKEHGWRIATTSRTC